MKQLILLLLLLAGGLLKAQVIPMQNGTGRTIDCAAADTGGRVFTYSYDRGDSIIASRWDPQTQTWFQLPIVRKRFESYSLKPDCQVLPNNDIIVAGVKDTSKFAIYSVSGNTWTRIGVFVDPDLNGISYEKLRLYQFKNKVYLVTTIDSVAGYPKSRVYEMNSGGLVSLNFQVNSPEYHMAMKGDTLAISANNSIYYYSAGVWSLYYKGPYKSSNTIKGMTGYGTYLYVTEYQNTISQIYNGIKIDSVTTALDRPELYNYGNRILISERKVNGAHSDIWSFTNIKIPEINARLGRIDSFPTRFIATKNKLYFYKEREIWFNKINCGGIAELDVKSLIFQGRDTIVVRTYIDHNKNYKKDAGDKPISLYVPSIYSDAWLTTNTTTGEASYIVLDNQDICFRPIDGFKTDSCYSLQHSAGICSKTYNSISVRDTIDFAFQSSTLTNIKVKAYHSGQKRIDTEFETNIDVFREDCNASKVNNINFYIDIAPGTEIIRSTPAYTSKSGNRLYYNLSLWSGEYKRIKLVLKYPFANFKLNDRVSHIAFIAPMAGEDTDHNRDSVVHRCVYSYDPNVKYSLPEGKVFSGLKRVRYHIEFQNEGNDYAYRVRVVDTLNIKIPVYEFRMIAASHDYKVTANGNVLTWTFDNIMLAPKSLSEAGSKGYIEFDANISSDIRVGDSIYNNAMIYFDLNEPIRTNNATIIRASKDNSIGEAGGDRYILYPNPATTYIYVDQLEAGRYTIYNSIGQEMGHYEIGNGNKKLEFGNFSAGIYSIRRENGEVYRFVVE